MTPKRAYDEAVQAIDGGFAKEKHREAISIYAGLLYIGDKIREALIDVEVLREKKARR